MCPAARSGASTCSSCAKKLGGGGHLTMAGAQLYQTGDMEEAIALVKQSIQAYLEETGD